MKVMLYRYTYVDALIKLQFTVVMKSDFSNPVLQSRPEGLDRDNIDLCPKNWMPR
jgi:hypothetical protein